MRPLCFALLCLVALGGCGTIATRQAPAMQSPLPEKPAAAPPAAPGRGAYYKDDGPGDNPPPDLAAIPDAVPKPEPLNRFANRPYQVFGRDYVPVAAQAPFRQSGTGSWYGRRFHGAPTSSGEPYDMYGMTAAHPTLPIPSYVRVSNPASGKSVVVRVNDRGPFHSGRLIDLSWTAAYKLGYIGEGSTVVEVESLLPGQTLVAATTVAPALVEDPIAQLAAAEPEPPLPQVQDARGRFLQLGAFGNRDNAEALRSHLARELGDLAGKLVVQSAGKLFRVQLGPWPDAAAAQEAGRHLRESFGMTPVVVQR